MKKILSLVAFMMLITTTAFAQDKEKLSWHGEAGIGSEIEIGARVQYNFNQYVSWDMLHAKYAFDYNKGGNFSEISLTTGVRGYSPTFGPEMKAFAAFDLGYGMAFDNYFHSNHFAIDFTIGLQYKKNLYFGYGLGSLRSNGAHKDHLLRIGWNF